MEGFRRKRLFFHEKRHSVWAKILFTVVISSCIILLTCHGLNRLMADSKEEEKRSLEEALQRDITRTVFRIWKNSMVFPMIRSIFLWTTSCLEQTLCRM